MKNVFHDVTLLFYVPVFMARHFWEK